MNLRGRARNSSSTDGVDPRFPTERQRVLGQDEGHLFQLEAAPGPARVQKGLLAPLDAFLGVAREAGFEPRIASGYRSFGRQLAIWNAKARGERPILGEQGEVLEVARLSQTQMVEAIMRWSALPGASRHHWGTDIDVYDAAALPEGYTLQLTQAECEELFAPFHEWLSAYLKSTANPGFYRPYEVDRGGVAPEPWHLSYAPLASEFERVLTPELLHQALSASSLALKEAVLASLPELFARFVPVAPAPPGLLGSDQAGSA